MATPTSNEATTRAQLVDAQLAHAGWNKSRRSLIEEFVLTAQENEAGYNAQQFADYVLLGSDGKPLAVVEAKRTSRDELAGKRQAADYADIIKAKFGQDPFIFLTNGNEIQFWDRVRYAPRKVSGFYTRDDLERLHHQRQFAQALQGVAINADIAGRDYQNEAIRRVTEGVDAAKRKFLLVMATGTGKTRTTIALVDTLLRAKRVQRVLFLADRRELVRQAMSEFKSHLPNESLARIESGETSGARIQFSTYPSMMQVYSRLSVGYYDLIVADESHRSIYQRYKSVFDHFDAIHLGLTATPTDYIDHNTFELFDCRDGVPSYYYSYEQAVAEKNLVNYRVLDAQTNFQLKGIQGDALPQPLQQMARDQGVEPDELNFDGSDIEKGVINQGTNDAMVREFMDKSRKDIRGLPHKSIIFAVSHAHAKRLYESFNRLYPELQRQGLAEIIDSHMERADSTLDDFKFRTMPRVAISVDMLDTGVDVPAIQNLVFAKPVFSKVKFWQMIGRGTRLHFDKATGEIKKDFLIIDHWKNFAYFKLKPDGEVDHPSEGAFDAHTPIFASAARDELQTCTTHGEALWALLGGAKDASAFDLFTRLLELRQAGLFDDVLLRLRRHPAPAAVAHDAKSDIGVLRYEELSDGEQMFMGRMALFHLVSGRQDSLLLLDEPETHFNDLWKRDVVSVVDDALAHTSADVLIATHAALMLTDALKDELIVLERTSPDDDAGPGESGIRTLDAQTHTFGATGDHPLRDVFGAPDTVGRRASRLLEVLIATAQFGPEVERHWRGETPWSDDLIERILQVAQLTESGLTRSHVSEYLNSFARFAVYFGVQQPLTMKALLEAFIRQTGPGYFQVELKRAWRRSAEEATHAP